MIKLIIFDLDGVLVDARDLHYHALNRALGEYAITREEHLSTYDGLPTRKKLELLTKLRGLPESEHDRIWKGKQAATIQVIKETIGKASYNVWDAVRLLKELDGFTICVASNSIRDSVKWMLLQSELIDWIDFWVSNEDVRNPKPNTEMYLRCMITAGVNPDETVIVEDSHIGRQAAEASGARLCAVTDPSDLSYDKVRAVIEQSNDTPMPKWQGNCMNVLIPMAGAGKRFEAAGYTFPKPLIDVQGKPMIQLIVENLNMDANFIFIVQKEHLEQYALEALLALIAPGRCTIVEVDHVTEGAACTTLLAADLIDYEDPLLIANSDQFVEWNSNEFMYSMVGDTIDGGILTFKATHPKWSFVKLGANGFVTEVAEKKPISDIATVGIYYWKHGSDYVKYANQMIDKDIRTNDEFYVCPVFNEAIADGAKIKTFHVDKMWGLGTPEDLEAFVSR